MPSSNTSCSGLVAMVYIRMPDLNKTKSQEQKAFFKQRRHLLELKSAELFCRWSFSVLTAGKMRMFVTLTLPEQYMSCKNNVLIMFGDAFFDRILPIFQVEVNRILTNTHKAVVFVWRLEFRHFPCDTTPNKKGGHILE